MQIEFLRDNEEFDLATLPERVATLEERTKSLAESHPLRNALIAVVITAVISGIGGWGWYVTTNLIAIKQQLADGGNTKIVAELKNPGSPAQLQANLSTVIAQIQTSRVAGTKPNTKKVEALSSALSQVVKNDPEIPEAWQAASALISYRPQNVANIPDSIAREFGPPVPNLGDCYQRPMTFADPNMPPPGSKVRDTEIFTLHDCTLYLDDLDGFDSSTQIRHLRSELAGRQGSLVIFMNLIRVKIVYRGGQLIPVVGIRAFGCSFEFDTASPPPPKGKELVEAILATDFSQSGITVNFPDASSPS